MIRELQWEIYGASFSRVERKQFAVLQSSRRKIIRQVPVHTTLDGIEIGALFLRGAFSKTLFKPEEFQNAVSKKQNILKTKLFKNDEVTILDHDISLPTFSSNTNQT